MNKIVIVLTTLFCLNTGCFLKKDKVPLYLLYHEAVHSYYGHCNNGYSSKDNVEKAKARAHCYQILMSGKQTQQAFDNIRKYLKTVKKEHADEILAELLHKQLID